MRKKMWRFKDNVEIYSVLYEDDSFILVFNDETEVFSFGMTRDFGSLCGFPVNWSCLNLNQLVDILHRFITIDEKYISETGEYATKNIERWNSMIHSATKFFESGYMEV